MCPAADFARKNDPDGKSYAQERQPLPTANSTQRNKKMRKEKLIKRLTWYYPTERFNALLFSGITVYVLFNNKFTDVIFLLYGLLLMVFILFQGQHYWKLKLLILTGKQIDQGANLQLFRKCKSYNVALIILMPLVAFVQFYLNDYRIKAENLPLWAIAANVFGILEHINYYHTQLTIDNAADVAYLKRNKKLKMAKLNKDLRDNKI